MPIHLPLLSLGAAPTDGVDEVQTLDFADIAGDENEIQTIDLGDIAAADTFHLTVDAEESAEITYSADMIADITAALEALAAVGEGNVTVTKTSLTVYVATFVGDLVASDVPAITITTESGFTPTGVTETLKGHVADLFYLTHATVECDDPVTYSADMADDLTAALESLASIGEGNATVARTDANTYVVTFAGTLAGTDVSVLSVTNAVGFTPLGTGGYTAGVIATTAGVKGTYRGAPAGTLLQNTDDGDLLINNGTANTPVWEAYSA